MGAFSSFPKDKSVLKSWSCQGQGEHLRETGLSSVRCLLLISASPVLRRGEGPKVEAWQCPKVVCSVVECKCILLE